VSLEKEVSAPGIKEWTKSPIFHFLVKVAVIFIVWELLNGYMQRFAFFSNLWKSMHDFLLLSILDISEFTLRNVLGLEITRIGIVIKVANSPGVSVGPACVGFGLQVAFAALIMAYEGPWKKKLWFIPLGMFGIHLINVLRVVVLAIMSNINNDWVDFNHKYVFSSMVYLFMFVMWVTWVRFLEKKKT
jgi:exosortase/archaeosortase family protein